MKRFDLALKELVVRWLRYDDTPRDPTNTRPLAEARLALDKARTDVAVARESLTKKAAPARSRAAAQKFDVDPNDLVKMHMRAIGGGTAT